MTTHYKEIPLSGLRIHPEYQRSLDEGRTQKIVAEFDPRLLGVLMVANDDHGSPTWVWDGQHRLEALRRMGFTSAWAQISPDTPKDQASLFVRAQEGRKNITPAARHRAQLFAGDPKAIEVNDIVASFGYRLSDEQKDKNVRAVRAAYWIFDKGGSDALRRTMAVVTSAWANLSSAFDDRVLKGLSLMLIAYPDLETATVVEALRNESPRALLMDSQARSRSAAGSNNHTEFARTVIKIVNKHSGRRLRDPFTRHGRLRTAKSRNVTRGTNGKASKAKAVVTP